MVHRGTILSDAIIGQYIVVEISFIDVIDQP